MDHNNNNNNNNNDLKEHFEKLPFFYRLSKISKIDRYGNVGSVQRTIKRKDPKGNEEKFGMEYVTKGGKEINASKVLTGNGHSLIATQCPKEETMDAFLDLIYTSNHIDGVVCLSNETDKSKMYRYWEKPENYGEYQLETEELKQRQIGDVLQGNLTITNNNKTKSVEFYLYTGWPDQQIPANLDNFENFVKKLKNKRKLLVHCSAGAGRTGVFAACWEAEHELDNNEDPDPKKIIEKMRKKRQGMVQTTDQFDLVVRYIIRNNARLKKNEKFDWRTPYKYEEYFKDQMPEGKDNIENTAQLAISDLKGKVYAYQSELSLKNQQKLTPSKKYYQGKEKNIIRDIDELIEKIFTKLDEKTRKKLARDVLAPVLSHLFNVMLTARRHRKFAILRPSEFEKAYRSVYDNQNTDCCDKVKEMLARADTSSKYSILSKLKKIKEFFDGI